MELEEEYKKESGFDVGKIFTPGIVYYSDDYVKWLESKIKNEDNSEKLVYKGKCDHGYIDEFGNELFCSIKKNKIMNNMKCHKCKNYLKRIFNSKDEKVDVLLQKCLVDNWIFKLSHEIIECNKFEENDTTESKEM